MKTLKILGLLMTYPEQGLIDALPEIRAVLKREGWLPEKSLKDTDRLLTALETAELLDLQEAYVDLFDRTPSLSLHLFEHIHGDSRDRGQAMVDLDNLYREAGLHNESNETPDYLPLFLEYLSVLPVEQAREDLSGAIEVIAALGERLKKRESIYQPLFAALESAATRKPDAKAVKMALEIASGDLPDAATIDRAWEEQQAFDGDPAASNSGCPKAEDMLKRMEARS